MMTTVLWCLLPRTGVLNERWRSRVYQIIFRMEIRTTRSSWVRITIQRIWSSVMWILRMFRWRIWTWPVKGATTSQRSRGTPMRMGFKVFSPSVWRVRRRIMWRFMSPLRIRAKGWSTVLETTVRWIHRISSRFHLRRNPGTRLRRWRWRVNGIISVTGTNPMRSWFILTIRHRIRTIYMSILKMPCWGTWTWPTRGRFMWVRSQGIRMRTVRRQPSRFVSPQNPTRETVHRAMTM